MAWSAASAVKPHQGSVLTKCPSSAAPPASFVSSRSSMATNAQLPGPLRNFFSQSVISNGLHGMSQRRFPMSCVFVRCDVQPMYEIRRRSSARCTLSLSGFCRRQSDDSTTVALVSEQMRLRRLSLSTSNSDRVLQQMTPSMSRKIIGAEAVDGDMMDDLVDDDPRIRYYRFCVRFGIWRPQRGVPTNLASGERVRTCSETVPRKRTRPGAVCQYNIMHNMLAKRTHKFCTCACTCACKCDAPSLNIGVSFSACFGSIHRRRTRLRARRAVATSPVAVSLVAGALLAHVVSPLSISASAPCQCERESSSAATRPCARSAASQTPPEQQVRGRAPKPARDRAPLARDRAPRRQEAARGVSTCRSG